MEFVIRDAELADVDALQAIFERASRSNVGDRELLREHPEWLAFSSRGVIEGRTRVAVDDDGSIVGFATTLVLGGVAELEDLFVEPSWMRRGVATSLVRDAAARLHERRFSTFEVTANDHAAAFYASVGFEEIGMVQTAGSPARRLRRLTSPLD